MTPPQEVRDGRAGSLPCSSQVPGPGAPGDCVYNGDNWFPALGHTNTDCDDQDSRFEGLDRDGDGFTTCGDEDGNERDVFVGNITADWNPQAFPGACERCDAIDNDLDGTIDDGFDRDGDQAVFDYPADPDETCSDPYFGGAVACTDDNAYSEGDIDCDDANPNLNRNDLNSNLVTTCDIPPDCDEPTPGLIDRDGDGFSPCDSPPDCDDLDPLRYPGSGC